MLLCPRCVQVMGRSDNEAGGTPILYGMKGYGGRAGAGAGAQRAVASVMKPVRNQQHQQCLLKPLIFWLLELPFTAEEPERWWTNRKTCEMVVCRVWSVQCLSAYNDVVRATSENQGQMMYHRHCPNIYHLVAEWNVLAFLIHKEVWWSAYRLGTWPMSMQVLNVCVLMNVSVKNFWCVLHCISLVHWDLETYVKCSLSFSSSSSADRHPRHPRHCPQHQCCSPSLSSLLPSMMTQAVCIWWIS